MMERIASQAQLEHQFYYWQKIALRFQLFLMQSLLPYIVGIKYTHQPKHYDHMAVISHYSIYCWNQSSLI